MNLLKSLLYRYSYSMKLAKLYKKARLIAENSQQNIGYQTLMSPFIDYLEIELGGFSSVVIIKTKKHIIWQIQRSVPSMIIKHIQATRSGERTKIWIEFDSLNSSICSMTVPLIKKCNKSVSKFCLSFVIRIGNSGMTLAVKKLDTTVELSRFFLPPVNR